MTVRARVTEEGRSREMDAAAFFELPLTARVRHVLDGTVLFFRDGAILETRAYLAERQASSPTASRARTRPRV